MDRLRSKPAAVAGLMLAALFWAASLFLGEALVEEINPVSLVALRWLFATIPLVVLARLIERPDWRQALRSWPWILFFAFFGLFLYNLLLYYAFEDTSAVNAALITAFNPALISAAAAIILKDRLTPFGIAGIALALFGVLIVLGVGDIRAVFTSGFGIGEIYLFGAIIMWTFYTILARVAPPLPPITSIALQSAFATVIALVCAPFLGGLQFPQTPEATWGLVALVLLPSVGSYVLWDMALRIIPPSRGGVFLNLVMVFSILIALVIGDPVSPAQLIGGAIILGGVALTYISPRTRTGIDSSGAEDSRLR